MADDAYEILQPVSEPPPPPTDDLMPTSSGQAPTPTASDSKPLLPSGEKLGPPSDGKPAGAALSRENAKKGVVKSKKAQSIKTKSKAVKKGKGKGKAKTDTDTGETGSVKTGSMKSGGKPKQKPKVKGVALKKARKEAKGLRVWMLIISTTLTFVSLVSIMVLVSHQWLGFNIIPSAGSQ